MRPADQLVLRLTVIAGETTPDDYTVIWDELAIGRILRQPGVPHGRPNWSWGVAFPGKPQVPAHRGLAGDLEECKRRFRVAWSAVHAGLTEADVDEARRVKATLTNRPWNRHRRS